MNSRFVLAAALGLSASLFTSAFAEEGAKKSPVTWKKTVVEAKFRSEGASIGDVNKDGKNDIFVGDSWYEAPNWTKHDIRKPGDFGDGLHSYSACMTSWADDINGDGWVDQVVVGFPGAPAYWYENPKGKPGYWPQYEIWHSACNETPLYVDLFGEGRRVLVMGWQPKGKENEGQMAWFAPGSDPTQLWEMHAISEPSTPGKEPIPGTFKFSHGLGVGDLNHDGKADVICIGGWWEQPSAGRNASGPWAFHKAKFGEAVADMIAYDVNLDGKADVIDSSAHQFGIWWYEQGAAKAGDPEFTKHDLFPELVSETHALIAADINGDGLKDLVTGKRFWSHGKSEPGSDKPARLYWFEASKKDGKIEFTPHEIDDQSGMGTQFTVADFNGDGLLDIITSNKKGTYLHEQVRDSK